MYVSIKWELDLAAKEKNRGVYRFRYSRFLHLFGFYPLQPAFAKYYSLSKNRIIPANIHTYKHFPYKEKYAPMYVGKKCRYSENH